MTEALLTDDQIKSKLQGSAWKRDGDSITREWKFDEGFTAAIAFVERVAAVAEGLNHHPDILVHGWNNVKLTVSNHAAGGLTETDFQLAAQVDQLS